MKKIIVAGFVGLVLIAGGLAFAITGQCTKNCDCGCNEGYPCTCSK